MSKSSSSAVGATADTTFGSCIAPRARVRLSASSIVVVDRDAELRRRNVVARRPSGSDSHNRSCRGLAHVFSSLSNRPAADSPANHEHDAIVPSPLMPHLMAEWLVERAQARWPTRSVTVAPVESPVAVPWQRPGADGTHYVSFAEWTCPINCIEPRTCPGNTWARDTGVFRQPSRHTPSSRRRKPR
jgi:hypothetical protein